MFKLFKLFLITYTKKLIQNWFDFSPQQHVNHKTDEANRASLLLRTEIHLKQPMPTRLVIPP